MKVPSHQAIDEAHSATILELRAEPSAEAMRVFYSKLIEAHNYQGLEVQYINSALGKGVFATKKYEKGDLVLKEKMLAGAQHTQNKADALVCSFCFCFIGSIELQIARRLLSSTLQESEVSCSQDEQQQGITHNNHGDMRTDLGIWGHDKHHSQCTIENARSGAPVSPGLIESLLNESLHLPFTDLFPLPSIVNCPGGCEEELFCSETCAEAAWSAYHSLLCTGANSMCKEKDYLKEFINHANETNDIFLVAAKIISATILEAKRLSQPSGEYSKEGTHPLFEAWKPLSMGFKRPWWDSVALPADLGPDDEPEFRDQIKELCSHSLDLLKCAIFHEEYAALFSLQVYGNIIGMFELNNLDLVVASPVEDYFMYIDDLPIEKKAEAERLTKPLLDALGDEYDTPCQGTAFFPLQSCFNHSCSPNVRAFKRDEDRDGQAVLLATRPIEIGEEVTISYIDEDAPWEERKVMLQDYGFVCGCCKCLQRV